MNKQIYGWKPDLPDQRDFLYKLAVPVAVPPKVDLRQFCPPVYDQGQLGSCTANAIGAAMEFEQIKKKATPFVPSRLFIYYNERSMEGTVNSDSGAMIRDGVKSVNKLGVCKETTWPYIIAKFKTKPVKKAFTEGLKYESKVYSSVGQDMNSVKSCLASGDPIVFGFTVYESFEGPDVAKNGIMPMPAKKEKSLGGHAVLAVGYDDSKKWMIIRNSWSNKWGDKGYFYMPYDYFFSKLTSDFWVIKDVAI
jgi:C1A family cysteine protease